MKLNKFLRILFFAPIVHLIGIPDNNNGSESNDDGNEDAKNNDSINNDDSGKNKDDDKLFSQSDLEKKIEQRLKRQEKQLRKQFDDELKKSEMTEYEKLKAEKSDLEQKANETIEKANKRLIRAEVTLWSTKLNIVDSDAAYQLMDKEDIEVDETGKVDGVEEALKKLIEKKTYLAGNKEDSNDSKNIGDDQQGKQQKKGGFDMNAAIRKAAGR